MREDWDTQVSGTNLANIETERCHRSPLSTSGVATGYLATDFPDILPVFKSVACSGGSIVEGAALDRDAPVSGNSNEKPAPGGVLRSYSGEDFLENFDPRPATPAFPAQLNQIDTILDASAAPLNRLDALIVGIGGNDAGFASYVSVCASVPSDVFGVVSPFQALCAVDEDLIAFRNARIGRLPGLYDRLAASIESNRLNTGDAELSSSHRPKAVLVTAIPRVAHKSDATFCASEPAGDESSKITAAEAQFIETTGRVPLNNAMEDMADDNDWVFVDSHVNDFNGHAICQSDRWINTNNDALRKQGELAASDLIPQDYSGGWVHPNTRGYSQIGGALYRQLARQLVARFTPVFTPRYFSENRANGMTLGMFFTDGLVLSERSGNYSGFQLLSVSPEGVNSAVAGADGFQLRPYSQPNQAEYTRTGRYLVLGRSCAPLARDASIGCSPPGQLRISTLVPQTPIEVAAKATAQSLQGGVGPIRVQWRHANPGAAHDTTLSRVRVTGTGAGNIPFDQTFTVNGRRTAAELGTLNFGNYRASVQSCNQNVGCSAPTEPVTITTGSITGFDPVAIRVAFYRCDRTAITWDAPSGKVLPSRDGTDGAITLSDPDRSIVPSCLDQPVGRLFMKPRNLRARPGRVARLTVGWEHPRRWGELRTVQVRLRRGSRIVSNFTFNARKGTLVLAKGSRSRGKRAPLPTRAKRTLRAGRLKLLLDRKTFRRPTVRTRAVRLRLGLVFGRALAGRRLAVEIGASAVDGEQQAFSRAGTIRVRRR